MAGKIVWVMDLLFEEREALLNKPGQVVEWFDKGEITLTGEREKTSRWPIATDGKAYHPRALFIRKEESS